MKISSTMSSRLISIFPCLSLMMSRVVFFMFLKITLCILLGCKFRIFLYFDIVFL